MTDEIIIDDLEHLEEFEELLRKIKSTDEES